MKLGLLSRRPKAKVPVTNPDPHTFQDYGTWGNSIYFFNWEQRRLVGCSPRMPREGDYFISKMESGKVARFRFVKVEPQWDPRDMFFATMEDDGYVTE